MTLSTAESLTGGLIGAAITAIPGSSAVYWGGIVSYSVDAKRNLLGVSPEVIERYGVVSEETARAMARGILAASGSDISIAVTGVAGPGGGLPGTPVGTVWMASARKEAGGENECLSRRVLLRGGRDAVRSATVRKAIALAMAHLDRA